VVFRYGVLAVTARFDHPAPMFESIAGVADVAVTPGAGGEPEFLIEIPHGATRAAHFTALRDRLRGPFAEDLREFFFVNTDVGAPEVGARLAERLAGAGRRVVVIRCLLPRTFVDCNRVIAEPKARASAAGEMTPGLASYVTDAGDLKLLYERYAAYRALVTRAYEAVCGAGGFALMLHSYAPRSIDVPVDDRIVERLREAYRAEVYSRWPLRAEVDLITRDADGRRLAGDGVVEAMRAACARAGLGCVEGEAYALHPVTLGYAFAARWPGRTLCVEMRRDLLVQEFTPFAEMDVDLDKADRFAAALADGLR
jgi:hypothetical protein